MGVLSRIGCVMVSVLASSAVDRGFDLFKPRSGQTKDYAIGPYHLSVQELTQNKVSIQFGGE
jgi:hypothetical protein